MNEDLLKKIIQYKLSAAGRILEHLPAGTSEKLKTFGNIVYKSVGEQLKTDGKETGTKSRGKINNVPID